MHRRLLLASTLFALAATGCGGSDSSSSDTAPGAPAAGGSVAIGMKNLKFDPADVTVKVGQTVTWTNLEEIPHNVVAESGADFRSSTFGKGKTFEFKAEEAGAVTYVCTIHPGMDGTVTVEG